MRAMHESRFDEADLDLPRAGRYPYGLFLLLSFLLHLTLFLLARGWDFEKAPVPIPDRPDDFIQLVDPPAPKKQEEVLFGTDRPSDLESIPKGKETRLPPIPKSTDPPGGPGPARREGVLKRESPLPVPPEARALPAPIPLPPPAAPARPAPDQDAVPAPSPPVPPSAGDGDRLPQPSIPLIEGEPGEKSAPEAPSRPGGLPGLPFADSQSLDRLAKIFSGREQAPPKDTISINTDELKYFSYLLKVKNRIEYVWRYPANAAERRMEGDLLLNFTIQRDGTVIDVAVASSSGYELLDREAVRAIQAASPFAPLPEAWEEDHITITGHFLYLNRTNYIR